MRRAARLWASRGQEIEQGDLPAILRATMLDVRTGVIEPAVAQAIASLAKTSVALSANLELEARIVELEQAAGITPANMTRMNRRAS